MDAAGKAQTPRTSLGGAFGRAEPKEEGGEEPTRLPAPMFGFAARRTAPPPAVAAAADEEAEEEMRAPALASLFGFGQRAAEPSGQEPLAGDEQEVEVVKQAAPAAAEPVTKAAAPSVNVFKGWMAQVQQAAVAAQARATEAVAAPAAPAPLEPAAGVGENVLEARRWIAAWRARQSA